MKLLKVLVLPEIPLHNNAAELAARAKVRKRDVSLQTITEEGTKANDIFMTIVQTAKKLGVSAYQYIFDRVNDIFEMTSLAQNLSEKKVQSLERRKLSNQFEEDTYFLLNGVFFPALLHKYPQSLLVALRNL